MFGGRPPVAVRHLTVRIQPHVASHHPSRAASGSPSRRRAHHRRSDGGHRWHHRRHRDIDVVRGADPNDAGRDDGPDVRHGRTHLGASARYDADHPADDLRPKPGDDYDDGRSGPDNADDGTCDVADHDNATDLADHDDAAHTAHHDRAAGDRASSAPDRASTPADRTTSSTATPAAASADRRADDHRRACAAPTTGTAAALRQEPQARAL